MRKLIITLVSFILLAICLISAIGLKKTPGPVIQEENPASEGIVVMELFTSQGCSSCPPADELLGKYAREKDSSLFVLAFHVDYWNRLGWKDPFSNEKAGERQRSYASKIAGASVYTPQLIINGSKEMVGSNIEQVASSVKEFKSEPTSINLAIGITSPSSNSIQVGVNSSSKSVDVHYNVALVQEEVETDIARGENRGLHMKNYNVVRDFKTVEAGHDPALVSFVLPAGLEKKEFLIIAYAQDVKTGRILGAAKIHL